MLCCPRQRPVRHRLRENHHIARVAHDLADMLLVLLIQAHLLRARIVALMAAGDNDEPTGTRRHISQLKRHHGQAVVHSSILKDVILIRIEPWAR